MDILWGMASIAVSVLVINCYLRQNRQFAETDVPLEANILLAKNPIIFVSSKKSFFYYRNQWNEMPTYLKAHGFQVTELSIDQLGNFKPNQSPSGHYFFFSRQDMQEFETSSPDRLLSANLFRPYFSEDRIFAALPFFLHSLILKIPYPEPLNKKAILSLAQNLAETDYGYQPRQKELEFSNT